MFDSIRGQFNQLFTEAIMSHSTITPLPGNQLHLHPQFRQLESALHSINLAADALKGIGNLLCVTHINCDEQLNETLRSDASAVFQFIGTALAIPADAALAAANALEMESYQSSQGENHE